MDEDEYTRETNNNGNNAEEDDGSATQEDEDDDGSGSASGSQEEDGNTVIHENNASMILQASSTLASLSDPDRIHQVREVGHEAVWSLSTAKPGNVSGQMENHVHVCVLGF